jgi:hypothetical protein
MRPLQFLLRLGPLALTPLALVPPGAGSPRAGQPAALPPAAASPAFHDCNANGVEDAVDIARGTSCDADLDGVPDECQALARPRERAAIQEREGTAPAPAGV